MTRFCVTSPSTATRRISTRGIAERIAKYTSEVEPFLERFAERGLVIEVRSNHMPDGGLVTTFTDITPSVKAAEALERANATLERRVRERTKELTRLNTELERAKAEADEANVSKTRFVAAASHDILQPLNAARLYVTSLIERQRTAEDGDLVQNIDASLEAVEEIFAALLDISRLDTGAMKPEMTDFRIDELLQRLDVEFAPLAREKGLDLVSCRARWRCARTAACCGGYCRTSSPTPSNIRLRAACWSAAGAAARSCASTSTTPASVFRMPSAARCSRNSTASIRARGSRAASGWASPSSSASRACSTARWR